MIIVVPSIFSIYLSVLTFYIISPVYWQLLVGGFLFLVVISTMLAYLIYPPYSIEKYFKKKGPENIVIEHEITKKIIYILAPLSILGIALEVARQVYPDVISLSLPYTINAILTAITFAAIFSLSYALLKTLSLIIREEFQLYFAKSCFRILSKKEDEVEKMKYLMKGLNSYNKYLIRHLGLEITDLRQIFSTISSSPAEEQNKSIELISKAFERTNKLEPLVCLSMFIKVPEGKLFLTKEPLFKKIEVWGGFTGTAVSGITSVAGVVILYFQAF
jgi:hypothetical protein